MALANIWARILVKAFQTQGHKSWRKALAIMAIRNQPFFGPYTPPDAGIEHWRGHDLPGESDEEQDAD